MQEGLSSCVKRYDFLHNIGIKVVYFTVEYFGQFKESNKFGELFEVFPPAYSGGVGVHKNGKLPLREAVL